MASTAAGDSATAASENELPPFRFALETQTGKMLAFGSAKQVTAAELPISQDLAGVSMWLQPGAVRELHWHANADEWGFAVAGSVRVTAFDPEERMDIADAGPGDIFYFPRGHGHAIQNAGTAPAHFILIFDNGHFSEFATFSSTDWLAHTPPDVLVETLRVPTTSLAGLPKGEAYIVSGSIAPPLASTAPLSRLSGPQRQFRVGIGRPSRHNGNLFQRHPAKGAPLPCPILAALGHDKAEAHSAQVAAFRQSEHVAAGLGFRHVQAEREAPAILGKPERP
mgnify:CR=1 FL=1